MNRLRDHRVIFEQSINPYFYHEERPQNYFGRVESAGLIPTEALRHMMQSINNES